MKTLERPDASDPAPPSEAGGTAEPRGFAYQPALDGIRALAVLAVMLYHGGSQWAGAGFLGVDVFLVLSGFLITLLLLVEFRRTGTIDRKRFWIRRARRLLPALFAVIAVVCLYALLFAGEDELERIRLDGLASLFYVQNWRLILSEQSYFAQFGLPSPFRHMWSLAIEEQWYIIWPLIFLFIMRVTKGRLGAVAAITGGLAAASAIWMIVLYDPNVDPSRVYYGTDTRAQSLLIGALLAMLWTVWPGPAERRGRIAVQALGIAGGLYLAWLVYTSNDYASALYQGGFTLVAFASAAVIAAAMTPGPLRLGLALPPLPQIGRISYGLYLWHWPIYVYITPDRFPVDGKMLLAVRMAVTFVVAYVSYRFLEMPIRAGRWPRPRLRWTWVPAAAAVCVVLLLVSTSSLALTPVNESAAATNPLGISDEEAAELAEAFDTPAPPGAVKALVAGDSVAFTLTFWGLPDDLQQDLWVRGAAILGCGLAGGIPESEGRPKPQSAECKDWPARYRAAVDKRDPDVAVLLVGAWEVYDRKVDGEQLEFGSSAMDEYLLAELERARRILSANGAHLVLLSTPCYQPADTGLGTWGVKERGERWRIDHLNGLYREFQAQHPDDVTYIDLDGFLCPGGQYAARLDGQKMRTDGVHLTKAGSQHVWEWLGEQLPLVALAHPREQTGTPPPAGSTTG